MQTKEGKYTISFHWFSADGSSDVLGKMNSDINEHRHNVIN